MGTFFKKILIPTDFSDASLKSMSYTVKMVSKWGAELIILHTFRLLDHNDGTDILQVKQNLEKIAIYNFNQLEADLLKASNLKYTFQNEVGFLSDRIISNVKKHNIDLVILCPDMQVKLADKKSEKDYDSMLKEVTCPVMLLPDIVVAGVSSAILEKKLSPARVKHS